MIDSANTKKKKSLVSTLSQDGRTVKISVGENFDFSVHKDFRDAYESAGKQVHEYIIDLGKTCFMDSSALGMMLLLRDYAGGDTSSIKIINTSPDIDNVLSVSNFGSMFTIS